MPARQAVAAALDLTRIARNVAPAEPAVGGFLHPASRWAADARVQVEDVRAARQAIADLQLPPVRVLAPDNDPVRSEAGRQVVLALQRAGASATLIEVSSAQLSRAIGEDGSPPDFDAAITSIPPLASQDPDYLRTVFGSDPRTAPLNVTGYRSDAFDTAARRVASAPNRTVRRQAILQELRLLARAAPSIPLFFSEGTFAHRSEIYSGWTFVRGTGILDKRSFLQGGGLARGDRRAGAPADDQADSGSGLRVFTIISLVLLGGVVVLAVVALLQRRSS